jgi:hypothetical protein
MHFFLVGCWCKVVVLLNMIFFLLEMQIVVILEC